MADFEELIITVGGVNTTGGAENISVPIFLNNSLIVYGFQLGISHDEDLIFKNVSLTSRTENAVIEFSDSNGEILIAAVLEEGISEGDESVLNLIFDL